MSDYLPSAGKGLDFLTRFSLFSLGIFVYFPYIRLYFLFLVCFGKNEYTNSPRLILSEAGFDQAESYFPS